MLNLFFPSICRGCHEELVTGELEICSSCRHKLPIACFHRNNSTEMLDVFYGRIAVENATALFYFYKGGLTQKFIHALKYRGVKKIGIIFGQWLGEELAKLEAYKNIDGVIAVPLHKRKQRQRGFNQVEDFGREIAAALDKPFIEGVLVKVSHTGSQVFKERFSRLFSSKEVFEIKDEFKIENKHILLVDDILTSGATLEACGSKLLKIKGVKVSFATMAVTK